MRGPLELPRLQRLPALPLEPGLAYGQYVESYNRFVKEQDRSDSRKTLGLLWSKLRQVRVKGYAPRIIHPEKLGIPRDPGESAGVARSPAIDRWSGTTVHSVGLYAVLRTAHGKIEEVRAELDREGNLAYMKKPNGYALSRGVGTTILSAEHTAYLMLPPNLSTLGLVVATYAMNDHINRVDDVR